jgi:serine/threonine kinase 32
VRVVEYKRTKELYALKYIDKAKCIKQKAVANIIQERRLLEEVKIPLWIRRDAQPHQLRYLKG